MNFFILNIVRNVTTANGMLTFMRKKASLSNVRALGLRYSRFTSLYKSFITEAGVFDDMTNGMK